MSKMLINNNSVNTLLYLNTTLWDVPLTLVRLVVYTIYKL